MWPACCSTTRPKKRFTARTRVQLCVHGDSQQPFSSFCSAACGMPLQREQPPAHHHQHPCCCSGHSAAAGWSVGPSCPLLLDLSGHAAVIDYRASGFLGAAAVAVARSAASARSTAACFAGCCRRCRSRLLLHAGCDGPCSTASCLCCAADPVILERLLLGAAAPGEAALQTLKPAPTQHGNSSARQDKSMLAVLFAGAPDCAQTGTAQAVT